MYLTIPSAYRGLATSAGVALLLVLAACSQHASETEASATPASSVTSAAPAVSPASPAETAKDEQDEANESSGSPAATTKTAAKSDSWHRGPRIKGIQLGDSLEEVMNEVKRLSTDVHCQLRAVNASLYPLYCDGTVMGGLEFDSGHLSSISITGVLSENIFGSMPLKDFVRNFASAYGIPRMDAQTGTSGAEYLAYRDDGGWEVDIFANKTFLLKGIATSAQQASKFN